MGRRFKLYKKNKQVPKIKKSTRRIIGELPLKEPIYGSKSDIKYDYMDPSPLEKKICKLNDFKKIELSKFPTYDDHDLNNLWGRSSIPPGRTAYPGPTIHHYFDY